MKINKKRFLRTFIVLFLLFNVGLIMGGCTAAWIGAINALLPALSAAVSAILSFVFSLEGKTVPASVTASIQKIVTDIQTQLSNLQTLISQVQSGGTTVLGQIEAGFNGVLADLSSILSGLNITDSSTLQKITELVGLAVAAVQAILAIIPIALKKVVESPSNEQLEALDKATATNLKGTHKAMQQAYHAVVTTPTVSLDVNTALEALPQSLP